MDSIGGVLEMNGLPKDQIIDFFIGSAKENILPQDGLLYKLGIFGFAIVCVFFAIVLLFLLRYMMKKYTKV